jgi:predicted ribosome quality control (RQC) complex YloA/Tae2 family protein
MKVSIINNIRCIIGQNAAENWKIFDNAEKTHLFFHLSSFPSGYVIAECENNPDTETLKTIAKLCKTNTKFRNLKNIKVDYTRCNNLKKGENVGEVIYNIKKNVFKITV